MCLHTVSPDDMIHTVCCPAALMRVLGEAGEQAKAHPFLELERGVRSASPRHSDGEAASSSGGMW